MRWFSRVPGLLVLLFGLASARAASAQEIPAKAAVPEVPGFWKRETGPQGGTLAPTKGSKGFYRNEHTVEVKAGRLYRIDLTSSAFDTLLRIFDGKKRFLAEDDDSGGGTNSRLLFLAPRDDRWKVEVSNFVPEDSGPYQLLIYSQGEPLSEESAKAAPLAFRGELTSKDVTDRVRLGCRAHVVHAILDKGTTYVIDLESKEFDAFLRLEDLRKKELKYDDDSGGGFNARLTFEPPETATYRIVATTYVPGAIGAYTLKIRKSQP